MKKVTSDYFACYHWSLGDAEEPVEDKVYDEPDSDDEDALNAKAKVINARTKVGLSQTFHVQTSPFLMSLCQQIRKFFPNHGHAHKAAVKTKQSTPGM